jgi:hypothetical protein
LSIIEYELLFDEDRKAILDDVTQVIKNAFLFNFYSLKTSKGRKVFLSSKHESKLEH